jgi:DNA-binding MarR family transcriptional regulator
MHNPSALTDHLGYWLRAVSNHVSHGFAARVANRDVTVAEWVMLRALYGKAPTPPSILADEMGVTRGAVTKLADRLIAKALILRKASAEDGRAQTLALTPKGARLVPDLAALADRNDRDAFAALSPSERKNLEKLLRRIAADRDITAPPLD